MPRFTHLRRPLKETQADPVSEKLHKMLAMAGKGSRRDMEVLIDAGRVSVNGRPAQVGDRVGPGDVVRLDGREVKLPWHPSRPRVLLYHKPEGEIVSRDDPGGRPSVFGRLPRIQGARWVSVGRLDFKTEGLLIFTTSGELANRLAHPRYEIQREYAVRILGGLTGEQMTQLAQGVALEDGTARVDSIVQGGGEGANQWYHLVLREGRNREVRRLIEALGLTLSRLIRVRFGPVALPPRLKRGMVQELAGEEVEALLEWCGLARTGPQRGASSRNGQAKPAQSGRPPGRRKHHGT
jgi:23S rRNA pseudouridine2605 synthase